MCEIKFYNDEFTVNKEYHLTLCHRHNLLLEIIPKRYSVHNTLITTYGLKHNEYYSDFTRIVTMDDLFQEA